MSPEDLNTQPNDTRIPRGFPNHRDAIGKLLDVSICELAANYITTKLARDSMLAKPDLRLVVIKESTKDYRRNKFLGYRPSIDKEDIR